MKHKETLASGNDEKIANIEKLFHIPILSVATQIYLSLCTKTDMALEPENDICVICLLFLLDRRKDKDMKPEHFFC